MNLKRTWVIALTFCATISLAQTDLVDTSYWKVGASIGLDLSQLALINPRVGAGENRIAFGGFLGVTANYEKEKNIWQNLLNWKIGLARQGNGKLADDVAIPFEKSLDEFRIESKYGHKIKNEGKLYLGADFNLLTQVLNTHLGNNGKNYLTEINIEDGIQTTNIAKFLVPVTMTASVGLDYHPNEFLSIFFTTFSLKTIFVSDDEIAQLGVHGNDPIDFDDLSKGYKNSSIQFGAFIKLLYGRKFANDRLIVATNLKLFSNYLHNPQNIDIDWTTDVGFEIVKGLQIGIQTSFFYDHDVLVLISDKDSVTGVDGLGRRISFTEQLLVKYSLIF